MKKTFFVLMILLVFVGDVAVSQLSFKAHLDSATIKEMKSVAADGVIKIEEVKKLCRRSAVLQAYFGDVEMRSFWTPINYAKRVRRLFDNVLHKEVKVEIGWAGFLWIFFCMVLLFVFSIGLMKGYINFRVYRSMVRGKEKESFEEKIISWSFFILGVTMFILTIFLTLCAFSGYLIL